MNKKISLLVGVLVVGLFTLFVASNKPASAPQAVEQTVEQNVGGSIEQQDNYKYGLGIGGDFITFARNGVIGPGANQVRAFRNTLGRDLFVELFEVNTVATTTSANQVASSTSRIYVGTTTPSTTLSDFTAPFASIIDAFPIATSTLNASNGTTTSNFSNSKAGRIVRVRPGEDLFVILQQNTTGCSGAVGVCETSTSTNRGFNLQWYFKAHYRP